MISLIAWWLSDLNRGGVSGLRCKPGDVCRVLALPTMLPWEREFVGCIVTVTKAEGLHWRFAEGVLVAQCGGVTHSVYGIADRALQPLRAPDADATDEMVARVGKAPVVVKVVPDALAGLPARERERYPGG